MVEGDMLILCSGEFNFAEQEDGSEQVSLTRVRGATVDEWFYLGRKIHDELQR